MSAGLTRRWSRCTATCMVFAGHYNLPIIMLRAIRAECSDCRVRMIIASVICMKSIAS
ncbi:hypothetical protein C8R48DRAFT_14195 [Suillus tomentosus]|nr:hypothetical protein C8R48DRAFT_14195 [Suillus tomentosus]